MIDVNATQLRAQAIEIHRTGAGAWNLYDASGRMAARLDTRDSAVEAARILLHVRAGEWRTTRVACSCGGDDDCARCGGHGEI